MAQILRELAQLLTLAGAQPYRARAYWQGA
ncbi:MAG: helix-hairpin-helix domain-containing protein [Casimicrobiaceae bacterium]